MLERMWRRGNPHALLVGMQTGSATMDNSMQFPQKVKNGTALWSSDYTSGNLSKETWNTNSKEPMHLCVHCRIFTITKIWKQPKCPSADEWIKKLWCIYKNKYYSAVKKRRNLTICDSMEVPGEHYAKCNKPVRERQVPNLTFFFF